jgi:hypothetical protein
MLGRTDPKVNSVDVNNPLNYLYNTFKQPIPAIKLKFVTSKEIENVVNSFKSKGSHGYDGIPLEILKQSVPYILSPLTDLCNLIISTGMFPTRLKFAEIKPLHKKGGKSNISNYRLISLLTYFSKIFKKIIFTRITHHLSDNHILAKEQFGFRNESSTDSASFKLINDILTSLNNKLLVAGIFCDLQKAFHCIDHDVTNVLVWYLR